MFVVSKWGQAVTRKLRCFSARGKVLSCLTDELVGLVLLTSEMEQTTEQ